MKLKNTSLLDIVMFIIFIKETISNRGIIDLQFLMSIIGVSVIYLYYLSINVIKDYTEYKINKLKEDYDGIQ